MKRTILAFAVLLMAGCSAKPQDMVARYTVESTKTPMVVKARANGDFRAEISALHIAMIGHGGKAFRLLRDNGVWVAVPIDSLEAACKAEFKRRAALGYAPPPPRDGPYRASAAGMEIVAGRRGDLWMFRDRSGGTARLVVSHDADLGPIGTALRQVMRLNSLCDLDPFNTNLARQMAPIEAKGTILRRQGRDLPENFFFTPVEFISLERATLPDSDFAMPSKILTDAEVRQQFAGKF